MSRTDWFIGLNDKAQEFLNKHCKKGKLIEYDDEGNLISEQETLIRHDGKYKWHSMFGYSYPLPAYTLKNGSKVYEKVQLEPWSSGPNIFTALVDENGKWIDETLWDEDEVLRNI